MFGGSIFGGDTFGGGLDWFNTSAGRVALSALSAVFVIWLIVTSALLFQNTEKSNTKHVRMANLIGNVAAALLLALFSLKKGVDSVYKV